MARKTGERRVAARGERNLQVVEAGDLVQHQAFDAHGPSYHLGGPHDHHHDHDHDV